MFGAVLQGSLFGLVGKLPPRFNSLFMSGQAVAGIFSGIAMLLSNICKYLKYSTQDGQKKMLLLLGELFSFFRVPNVLLHSHYS